MQAGLADPPLFPEPDALVSHDADPRLAWLSKRYDLRDSVVGMEAEVVYRDFPQIIRAHRRVEAAHRTLVSIEEIRIHQQIVAGRVDDLQPRLRIGSQLVSTYQITAGRTVGGSLLAALSERWRGHRRQYDSSADQPHLRCAVDKCADQRLHYCIHARLL